MLSEYGTTVIPPHSKQKSCPSACLSVVDMQGRTCICRLPWDSLFLLAEIAGHMERHVIFLIPIGLSILHVFWNELPTKTEVLLYSQQPLLLLFTLAGSVEVIVPNDLEDNKHSLQQLQRHYHHSILYMTY